MANFEQGPVFSPELSHLREYESAVADAMTNALAGHDHPVDGFTALENNTNVYPFQQMDCYKIIGNCADTDLIDLLASSVYENFHNDVDYFVEKRSDLLVHTADLLERGEDINVVTDHSNVIGVAVGGVILPYALYKTGKIDHGDIDTEIFVSVMIKYAAMFGTQAVCKLLESVFTTTRFSIPSSNGNNRLLLPSEARSEFHAVGLKELEERQNAKETRELTDKPVIRAIAGSATRDQFVRNKFLKKGGTIHMGPISDGTAGLLRLGYNLGLGIEMHKEKPSYIHVGSMKNPIDVKIPENANAGHTLMFSIAEGMSAVTPTPREYHMTREDFLQAVA